MQTTATPPKALPSELRPVTSREIVDFEQFYQEHHHQVNKALGLTLGDWQLGAEATNEAMVRAYERWNQVSQYESPAGWVYRVGLNWGRSRIRRTLRGLNPMYRPDVVAEPKVTDVDLQRALSKLSTDHRAVVVARYLFDWTVTETAQALEIREGTVKSRLHRALKELEADLGEQGNHGASTQQDQIK